MLYDDFAERLKAEYDTFLFALSGRYLTQMAPGAQASPMHVNEFERGALKLRDTFLKTASRTVIEYVAGQTVGAVRELAENFTTELGHITEQNVGSLVTRMKGAKHNALDAVGEVHGAMGLLLQQKLATPEFNVTTASKRTFKAAPFVKSQARQFAYQTWLQFQMVALSWKSDLAQVAYDDPAHEHHGLIFSISGATPGYPSFDDLAQTVFHYNATAKIAAHVSP